MKSNQIITLVYATNRTNKPVGKIIKKEINGIESIVLEKSLRTRHILRNPPAICYDLSIIDQARAYGVQYFVAENIESGFTYTIPFDLFFEKSFKIDRGFGKQLGCCLSDWNATPNSYRNTYKYSSPVRTAQPTPKPTNYQTSFFDIDTTQEENLFDFKIWVRPEQFETASLIS